jgi:D-alanine transfer protein
VEYKPTINIKFNHLAAACTALALVTASILAGLIYAQWIESRYIHAIAANVTDQMTIGEAFLQQAVRQPDLLLVIGSSELLAENGPYQANHFFQTYPTGFDTFVVARAGLTSLNMAQDIAAAGPDLRGKKVVISFTPSMFSPQAAQEGTYPGNFSRLHALEFAFDSRLSWDLKRSAALRMLQYPETVEKDLVLRLALRALSSGSRRNRLLYYALLPIGKLETWALRLQDHWEAVSFIWGNAQLISDPQRQPASIDWMALAAQAKIETQAQSDNNPFGFDNEVFLRKYGVVNAPKKPGSADASFVNKLKASTEWEDLDILLRTLRELGLQSLVLSRPYSGLYYNNGGISIKGRTVFYDMLKKRAVSYGIPVIDFRQYDGELYFNRDATSHTSPMGWVYVNQALDAFFHEGTPNQ